MRLSRAISNITEPERESAPPERPVPAPRGAKGTPASARIFTAAATSSTDPGYNYSGWRALVDRQPIRLINHEFIRVSQDTRFSHNAPQFLDHGRVERVRRGQRAVGSRVIGRPDFRRL